MVLSGYLWILLFWKVVVYGNTHVHVLVLCCAHGQHISLGNGAGEDVSSGFTEQMSLHINAARREKDEALDGRETAQRTKVD